ncbi:MAG: hypothetical protein HYS41_07440 [Candidatus Omnitrophica bacterium]|nr:hypothetical protein [Candidatus Omnitrophota bacterium]
MRKFLRIAFILVALLSVAAWAGLEYLNRKVLPQQAKVWAAGFSQTIGRRIVVGKLSVHLWRGIELTQVAIGEDARYGKEDFLRIDRLSGRVLILPLVKEKRVILSNLTFVRPKLQLTQDAAGGWNIQSLAPIAPAPKAAPGKFQFLVPQITFTDGEIGLLLKDRSAYQLKDFDLNVHLALPAKVQWLLTTQLSAARPIPIQMEGTYDLPSRKLNLKNELKIPLESLASLLPEKAASGMKDLTGEGKLGFQLSGNLQEPLEIQGTLELQPLAWKFPAPSGEPIKIQGNLLANFQGKLLRNFLSDPLESLTGTVELKEVILGPLEPVGELSHLTGLIRFDSDGLKAEGLTAQLASGQALTLAGSVARDSSKTASLKVETALALSELSALSPQLRQAAKDLKLTGTASLVLTAKGPLAPKADLKPSLTANLEGASVSWEKGETVSSLQGQIHWKPDLLTVAGLTGILREQPFRLDGTLVDFNKPEIDAKIVWGKLEAETQLTLDGERIELHDLSGRYGGGTFRVLGEMVGRKELQAHLYGETSLKLEELSALWPQPPDWLKEKPLAGLVSARWILEGPLGKPEAWNLDLKLNSDRVSYQAIPLTGLRLEMKKEPSAWSLSLGQAALAGGTIGLEGSWLTGKEKNPWSGNFTTREIDLKALAETLKWETKNISGKLNLQFEGSGEGAEPNTFKGRGRIEIGGGRIAELPLLGQFADFLALPSLKTIVFDSMGGPFTVGEGKVHTEELVLTAPQATLNVKGWGGFLQAGDSPIQWRIFPTFAPELLPEESRSKLGRVIVKGTSYLIGEVRVEGTWKKPKSTFVSKPLTQILNEQIFNLEDILKEWF